MELSPNNLKQLKKLQSLAKFRKEAEEIILSDKYWGMDLPLDYFIFVLSTCTNPQCWGLRVEERFRREVGGIPSSKSKDDGDFVDGYGDIIESKTTILRHKFSKRNFVQIRTFEKINYYLFAVFDLSNSDFKVYTFKISKKDMEKELILCKAAVAHKKDKYVNKDETPEWRITLNDENFERWKTLYLVDDIV